MDIVYKVIEQKSRIFTLFFMRLLRMIVRWGFARVEKSE